MAERTLTELAVFLSQKYGRAITRRQVERYLEKGLFKNARKIEFGLGKNGVWLISDEEIPTYSNEPINRRQPIGPRERADIRNAIIPDWPKQKP